MTVVGTRPGPLELARELGADATVDLVRRRARRRRRRGRVRDGRRAGLLRARRGHGRAGRKGRRSSASTSSTEPLDVAAAMARELTDRLRVELRLQAGATSTPARSTRRRGPRPPGARPSPTASPLRRARARVTSSPPTGPRRRHQGARRALKAGGARAWTSASSGARAAVLDADGRLLGSGRRADAHDGTGRRRAEQDPDEWVRAALAAGREAVPAAGIARVAAVGVAALGPAPVAAGRRAAGRSRPRRCSRSTRARSRSAPRWPAAGLRTASVTHDHALPKLVRCARRSRSAVAPGPRRWSTQRATSSHALTGRPAMDAITAAEYALPGHPSPLPAARCRPIRSPSPACSRRGRRRARARAGRAGDDRVLRHLRRRRGVRRTRARRRCALLGSTGIVAVCVDAPPAGPGLECVPYPGAGLLLGGWTTTAGARAALVRGPARARRAGAGHRGGRGAPPGAGGLAGPAVPGRRAHAASATPGPRRAARPHAGTTPGKTTARSSTPSRSASATTSRCCARPAIGRRGCASAAAARATRPGCGDRRRARAAARRRRRTPARRSGPATSRCAPSGLSPSTACSTVEPDPARAARFDALVPLYARLHPAARGRHARARAASTAGGRPRMTRATCARHGSTASGTCASRRCRPPSRVPASCSCASRRAASARRTCAST